KNLSNADRARLPPAVKNVLDVPVYARTKKEKQVLTDALRKGDQARHLVGGLGNPLNYFLTAHVHTALARAAVEQQITTLKRNEPRVASTLVMQERAMPRVTHVQIRGDFLRKGPQVTPGVPAVLHPLPAVPKPTRLDLARWLVDPRNPLTPRVTMNRFWQHYFGTGLVETENDFGTQGTPPTHPELLDWLATEFVARKWSMKSMHRLIVTSATYRQSSRSRPDVA